MISYSVLFINRKLCSTEAFSRISNQTTEIKTYNKFDNLSSTFAKSILPVKNKKNEHHQRISNTRITLNI